MGTKTISIMDDVYEMLIAHKVEDESFSEELRRVLSERKSRPLREYFGLLSKETGKNMLNDLEKIKKANRVLLQKGINETS